MTQTLPDAAVLESERVEMLLIDLSTRFINLPPDQVDRQIQDAQQQICEYLGLDRSTLWQQPAEDPGAFLLTHIHQRPDDQPPPARMEAGDFFPWVLQRVRRGETVAISNMDDLPAEAARDGEVFRSFATKSTLVIPLSIGGGAVGALTFASCREPRDWPETLVKRLQLVGEVFTNAIARARSDQALRQSRERYALAVDGANDGLWDWDLLTNEVYFSPRWKGMLGYQDHELANEFSVWQALLHPDDRDRASATLEAHLSGKVPVYELEHRLRHKDGSHRWILARGKAIRDSEGHPYRMAGSHSDITERKEAEAALAESRAQILAVFESTNDFIWSVDPEKFGILTFNTAFASYFLQRRGIQLRKGMTPAELVPPEYAKQWHEFFTRAREEGSFITEYVTVSGTNILLLSLNRLERNGEIFGISVFGKDITDRKRVEQELRRSLEEVQRLREQLQQQNVYLRQEVELLQGHTRLVGRSEALKQVLAQVEQVAPTGSTVLLLGETGTGKELVASAIHELSPRRGHPMVRVNCSAIPESLIESELFGREKGAYTGALSKQIGRFELANGSTLFLDEIGDLPPDVQIKLLRVLQEKQIERLGSPKPITVDVRIIAATNQDLESAIREGRFRQDLYYRLNVFPIRVPPLRERGEDIPLLVSAFVEEFGAAMGKSIESIDRQSMDALQRYTWPGNVRELRNVIERAMIVAKGSKLWVDLPGSAAAAATPAAASPLTMKDVDREHIHNVLKRTGWRIRGANGAAEILGIKPTTLESRMAKLGIRRSDGNSVK